MVGPVVYRPRCRVGEEVGMRVQRVVMPDGSDSWTVLDECGEPVPAVEAFLAHL
jgi:hypothetical protein